MSTGRLESPEEPHWTTEWSSQNLTAEEKNVFEDVIADLYDWIALSVESCHDSAKQHCRALPPVIKQERVREYYASIIRYILVELVICCESTKANTVDDKMKKLVNFIEYLVEDAMVVRVELINQELTNVCQDDDAYPHHPTSDTDSGARELSLSMFTNFHNFASRMYRKKLATTLQPARRAIEVYFGDTSSHSDEAFFATAQWLTCAHDTTYNSNPEYKELWASWYKEICVRTAEYGRRGDPGAQKYNIAGRTAQKGMERMDKNLMAFDKAVREGISDSARLDAKNTVTIAENAILVDQTIKILEATLTENDSTGECG